MMSEEMKLLMALCDALGFAVEVSHDSDERKVTGTTASRIHNNPGASQRALCADSAGQLDKDDQGMYTSYLIDPITSYKLTRLD